MEKWFEVDLDKLKHNILALQEHFKVPIMAVIKQNAYGLGAQAVGRFMEQAGIRFFAVTNVSEGIELRQGGVVSPILIFAPFYGDREELQSLWQYDLTPSVYSLEAAETLHRYALEMEKPIGVHVKVDTGMGRMGFLPGELLASVQRLRELDGLKYEGIFTHYSNAFEKKADYTGRQRNRLLGLVAALEKEGLSFPLKYSANSLAALKFPETHMDMVSIGSAFLGNSIINPAVPLKKVYRCKARVIQVRTLGKGSYVGYSNTFRTKKDTRVAIIPVGYTDGFGLQKKIDSFRFSDYLREQYHLLKAFLKPGAGVSYEGRPLRVIGKTSLQLTVVDIGDLPVKAGDTVDIDLNPLFASARLERVYVGSADPSMGYDSRCSFEEAAAATEQAGAGE